MNREERRKLNINKETAEKLKNLNKPCTILEAVQLSRGVADDSIKDYHESINPIIVSLSIQIEVLKEMLFESIPLHENVLDEKDFIQRFDKRVEDYNKQKEEVYNQIKEQSSGPKTDVTPGTVNIEVTK